jgi:hypothetical protein
MKRKDKALYLSIIVIIAAASLASGLFGRSNGELALEIASDGRVIKSSDLSSIRSGTSIVLHESGGTNVLLVSGDSVHFVRMISSDCPGGDCLRMAPLTSEYGVIVCLPHKLVIKLRAKKSSLSDDSVDAITY